MHYQADYLSFFIVIDTKDKILTALIYYRTPDSNFTSSSSPKTENVN